MNHDQRLVTQTDHIRLSHLLEHEERNNSRTPELKKKIEQLSAIEKTKTPRGLITMNTMFRGVIEHDGWPDPSSVRILTLTYPDRADISKGWISVLTPLGIDLLGAREGDVVIWPGDGESKKMLIDEVIFQPELSGDWQL